MNTEHTNQPSQAETATHSPIALQSIPKRQRDFTAENIRDIAHECMRIGDNEQAEVVFAIADALRDGNLIIQSPVQHQAEPVAWHTNDPCVSSEHIEAIAKVCKIIPSYTTVEYVARIVGFGHVLLADKSVQEAFVRANSHLLRTDAAQPPAVAALAEWSSVPQRVKDSITWLLEDTAQVAQHSDYEAGIKADHELAEACQLLVAMLAAAPQATAEDSSVVRGAWAVPTIKLGIYGKAFDSPQTRRAYTYREQPDNIGAYKLGQAVLRAASGGDSIDYGLALLKHLQARGFGVFELGDQQKGGA